MLTAIYELAMMRRVSFLVFLLCIVISFKNQNADTKKGLNITTTSTTSRSFSYEYAASDPSAFQVVAGALFLSDDGKLEEGGEPYRSMEYDFYRDSCPQAEGTIRAMVRYLHKSRSDVAPALLRLVFHDCFIEGCDASVLLQGNGTERSDPANASLGGFEVIDSAKRVLEIFCPGTVSCADIIALAARDSVEIAGGPAIQIPTGRRDGRASAAENVRANIVDTTFTMNEMIKAFSSKGLSMDDLVTLSGAHTIGSAHCNAFNDRFREDPKGKLTLIDTSLDSSYANELMRKCPANASSSVTVNNDPETSFVFDNQYYRNLLAHKGLFQSDSVLLHDERTRKQVENFANDQESFFSNWGLSFLKVTSIGVKTEDEGEIRQTCSMTNG